MSADADEPRPAPEEKISVSLEFFQVVGHWPFVASRSAIRFNRGGVDGYKAPRVTPSVHRTRHHTNMAALYRAARSGSSSLRTAVSSLGWVTPTVGRARTIPTTFRGLHDGGHGSSGGGAASAATAAELERVEAAKVGRRCRLPQSG